VSDEDPARLDEAAAPRRAGPAPADGPRLGRVDQPGPVRARVLFVHPRLLRFSTKQDGKDERGVSRLFPSAEHNLEYTVDAVSTRLWATRSAIMKANGAQQ